MNDKAKAIIAIGVMVSIIAAIIVGAIIDIKKHNDVISNLNSENVVLKQQCDSLENVISDMLDDMQNTQAECTFTVDSLTEELDIAKIKLDRIKEYNRIAGQGNNITFLRGWINRVLNN